MKTTIRDIANQLGVSASTVSKVINGKGSISPELRQRVLAVVEEANYQPNLNAKSLRTKTTNTIGVLLPDVTNLFYCYLMKGVEAKCQEENFSVLVGTCNYNPQREREYLDLFRSKSVTGIISVTIGNLSRFSDISMLVSTNEQVEGESQSDWVSIHNEPAARDLTQYLLNLGHRDIAYVNSGQKDTVSNQRLQGFLNCMKENGLDVPPDQVYDGSLFLDGSYQAGRRIILSSPGFDTGLDVIPPCLAHNLGNESDDGGVLLGRSGFLSLGGSLGLGAAGNQADDHHDGQKQSNKLLHFVSSYNGLLFIISAKRKLP